MTPGYVCAPISLGVVGDPQNLWITFPQAQCLGVMGVPWTTGIPIGPEKSGGHLEQVWGSFRKVWGSPMTPHHYLPPTTTNYPRGWFSYATTERACELWINSIGVEA